MKRFLLVLKNASVVFLAMLLVVSPATSFGAQQSTRPSPPRGWEPYVVKPGDHLGGVLFERGIGPRWGRNAWVERTRAANGMKTRYDLEVGETVYLPKANSVGWVERAEAHGPREKRAMSIKTAGTKSIVRRSLAQASEPIFTAETEEPVPVIPIRRSRSQPGTKLGAPPSRSAEAEAEAPLFRVEAWLANSRIDATDVATGAKATLLSDLNIGANVEAMVRMSEATVFFGEFGGSIEQYTQFKRNSYLQNPQITLARVGVGVQHDLSDKWRLLARANTAQTSYLRGQTTTQTDIAKVWVAYLELGFRRRVWQSRFGLMRVGLDGLYTPAYSTAEYSASMGYGARARVEFERLWRGSAIRLGGELRNYYGETSISKQERSDAILFIGGSY